MPSERAMTGFAADSNVFALGLEFRLFAVASLANLASRETDGPGANVVQGGGPEMTVFAKFRRHDQATDHQKCNYPQGQ
jgi:hypothetical protein